MGKTKRSKKKWIIPVIVVAVIIAALLFGLSSRGRMKNYAEAVATTGDITKNYSFSGTVAAKNSRGVYSEKVMQIKDVNVTENQDVKKGDVLMTDTAGDSITAPIDGTVTGLSAESGSLQTAGAQLCKVTDYSDLELDIQVDEYDLPAAVVGKDATVIVNALGKDVSGKVTFVSREAENQNGVSYFDAKISLPDESDLRVGMTAEAKIVDQSVKNAVILPMSAVQFDENNNPFVYVSAEKGRLKRVDISVGINNGESVEIKSGLASGDVVKLPDSGSSGGGFAAMRQGTGNKRDSAAGSVSQKQ